jgi:hypothetical protein
MSLLGVASSVRDQAQAKLWNLEGFRVDTNPPHPSPLSSLSRCRPGRNTAAGSRHTNIGSPDKQRQAMKACLLPFLRQRRANTRSHPTSVGWER